MKRTTTYFASLALAALSFGASAADITLNPSFGNTANVPFNVCDLDPGTTAPSCPAPGGTIENTVSFTVAFTTPGIENAGANFSVTPNGSQFTTFEWVFKAPGGAEMAHGTTGNNSQIPTDVSVGPGGDYLYTIHYILLSVASPGHGNLTSASFSMNITTGPATGHVPEPGSLALIAAGLIGLGVMRRRNS